MKDKTVLVTGASQGIGKYTALALAAQGARVAIVARNVERGTAALQEISRASGSEKIELFVADLSSLAEVRRLAAEFKARHSRLDVLVNNAGLLLPTRCVTVDGVEETFAVNHVAPFVLTAELSELLQASPPARVVTVSSEAHRLTKMRWDDLQGARERYSPYRTYGQSKLANILFTFALARRFAGKGVTANCLHPGLVASNFGHTYKLTAFLMRLTRPFLSTPPEGARTSIHLASSPAVDGVTGEYFVDSQPRRSSAASRDVAAQERLWTLTEELVGNVVRRQAS